MQLFCKRSEDLAPFTLDLGSWLDPEDSIAGASVVVPASIILQRTEYSDTAVVVWLAGGADRQRHKISVTINTANGQAKLVEFMVHTEGTPTSFTTVNVGDTAVTVGYQE